MANFVNIPDLMAPSIFDERLFDAVGRLRKHAATMDERNRGRIEEKANKLEELWKAFQELIPNHDERFLRPELVADINPICEIYVKFSVILKQEAKDESLTEGARGAVSLARDYLRGTGMDSLYV